MTDTQKQEKKESPPDDLDTLEQKPNKKPEDWLKLYYIYRGDLRDFDRAGKAFRMYESMKPKASSLGPESTSVNQTDEQPTDQKRPHTR